MHSDPVADMLTRIRNGYGARLPQVKMPHSRLKEHIAEILTREGFLQHMAVEQPKDLPYAELVVQLKYDEKRVAVVSGLRRLSTPGLRRYFACKDIPKVRNGLGIVILTTSRGLMTDHEARKAQVGGEALCSAW